MEEEDRLSAGGTPKLCPGDMAEFLGPRVQGKAAPWGEVSLGCSGPTHWQRMGQASGSSNLMVLREEIMEEEGLAGPLLSEELKPVSFPSAPQGPQACG